MNYIQRITAGLLLLTGFSSYCFSDNFVWRNIGNVPGNKSYHSSGVIGNKIYLIGDTIDEYDPLANTWVTKTNVACQGYAGIVNGKIYVISRSSTCEYDLAQNTWSVKSTMQIPRPGFRVVVVNDKIYALGGGTCTQTGPYDSTHYPSITEEYDPVTDIWTIKGDHSISYGASITVLNGKIYTAGGGYVAFVPLWHPVYDDDFGYYNTETFNGVTLKKMLESKGEASMVALHDKIYVIGGIHYDKQDYRSWYALKNVEEYNPETNTWFVKSYINVERWRAQAVVLNDKIYLIGGNGNESQRTVEEGSLVPDQANGSEAPGLHFGAVGPIKKKIHELKKKIENSR
ncbi:MAG: hypothetical protein A2297_04505 [Elusimicrobia bacterium RIFOXYB2_FULL_48_7]|nr:MAG: hypothetical protein A2297_04505 [Elusimicrobia bacterium RIFOXYB2_FULL_48_7]